MDHRNYDAWKLDNGYNDDDYYADDEREEAGKFCPMCDGADTYYTNDGTYTYECDSCGHEFDDENLK